MNKSEVIICKNLFAMHRHELEIAYQKLEKRGYSRNDAIHMISTAEQIIKKEKDGVNALAFLKFNRYLWPIIPLAIIGIPLVYSLGFQKGSYFTLILFSITVAPFYLKGVFANRGP